MIFCNKDEKHERKRERKQKKHGIGRVLVALTRGEQLVHATLL
jgi:hypothetical protein